MSTESDEGRFTKGGAEQEPRDDQGEGFVGDSDEQDVDGNTRDAQTDPATAEPRER